MSVLKISLESLGPSQVFPDLAQRSVCACGFHDPQKHSGDFKVPVDLPGVESVLCQLLPTASGYPDVQQLSLIVFDRYLQGKGCFTTATLVKSNKNSLLSGVFQGPSDSSSNSLG